MVAELQSSFLRALVPEPYTVLGRKLKPFSIGHEILLERFGSHYALTSEKAPGYSDLILSVFICSRTFEECLSDLAHKRCGLRLRAWGWYCGSFDVWEAKRFFARYIAEHATWPKKFWVEKDISSKRSGAPFVQALKVRLQKDMGYSESEALNAPYSVALWNYMTALENSGVIRLFSEEDQREFAAANDPELAARIDAIAKVVRAQTPANN